MAENADGAVRAFHAYEGREFLAATDERFRPVDLATGPDGALYVVDLYRGILQHRISLTTYLRRQILDCGLDQPLGRGRISRIVPEGAPAPAERSHPRFFTETPAQWVTHLSHPSGWWRQTAQRLLVERNERSVVAPLRRLVISGSDPRARLHALWTLDGLDLASCIVAEQNASRITGLFALLDGQTSDVARLLVEGASHGMAGARIAHLELPAAPRPLLALLRAEAPVSLRTAAARLERSVFWPDKIGVEPLPGRSPWRRTGSLVKAARSTT